MKLESDFKIGEQVIVRNDSEENIVFTERIAPYEGQVVKISFTKSKVYYDVLADIDAKVYHEIFKEHLHKKITTKIK